MDHGASTHPPTPVLETYKEFLEHSYANVHRGRHYLSEMATDRFEHVSDDIFRFIEREPRREHRDPAAGTPHRPSTSPPT